MKLISLQLHNFRQFYGTISKILFASSQNKNVTIIHGNNGSGKTALLNSLTWLFFEKFTEALQAPEQLINSRVIKEASKGELLNCWVELVFEHGEKRFRIKRICEGIKNGTNNDITYMNSTKVELQWAAEDGRWKTEHNYQDVIGRILPEQLHRYFFLDGERIEGLQRPDKRGEVVSATKIFIGEEIFIRAVRHLHQAKLKFEHELKQIGDAETKGLILEKDKFENQIKALEKEIHIHKLNIEGYKIQEKHIEESLRKQEKVQMLQQRRDELKNQKEELQSTLVQIKSDLANLVSQSGYKAFLNNAISLYRDLIEQLRDRGELPSSIKTPFVKELLRRGECICERGLVPGEPPYSAVTGWLAKCGISDIEEVAIRIGAEIDTLDREVPNLFSKLDKEQQLRHKYKEQLSLVEDELETISEKLKGSSEEEVRELEKKLEEVSDKLDQEKRYVILKEENIKGLKQKVEEIYREIRRREGKNAQQTLAQKRLNACIDAAERIELVQKGLRDNFRIDLSERIKRLFYDISFKPYVPILDRDYNLQLMESSASLIPVGASTGENQVLSLAFIGAIIEQARLFTAKRDRLPGPDSSEFPIVMDSPFGNLDPIYRRQIATRIPELANQVVIMVSKSQWDGEVEHATNLRIGKEYILEYNTPKADAEEAILERKGKLYQLVRKTSDEFESVNIVEVV